MRLEGPTLRVQRLLGAGNVALGACGARFEGEAGPVKSAWGKTCVIRFTARNEGPGAVVQRFTLGGS
jgi:hypothetical protein